jgi:excisionase family DNA binding protein
MVNSLIPSCNDKQVEERQSMGVTKTESPYLDYRQAAAYCNVERTTLYRAMKAGRLRASGPGTAIRFHRAELDRWMDSRNRK